MIAIVALTAATPAFPVLHLAAKAGSTSMHILVVPIITAVLDIGVAENSFLILTIGAFAFVCQPDSQRYLISLSNRSTISSACTP